MASVIPASLSRFRRSGSWIDDALYAVALYAVAVLILFGTLATLYFLSRQYESRGAVPLALRVVANRGDIADPAEALEVLRGATPVSRYGTRLSEKPIWFSFTTPSISSDSSTIVELPSRHTQTLVCWNADTLAPLGRADREGVSGEMRGVKTGLSIQVGRITEPKKHSLLVHVFRTGANQCVRVGIAGPAQFRA